MTIKKLLRLLPVLSLFGLAVSAYGQVDPSADAPLRAVWGSIDAHYAPQAALPEAAPGTLRLSAWRGERVAAQAVVRTSVAFDSLGVFLTRPSDPSATSLPSGSAAFVDCVLCDGKRGCGPNPMTSETYPVPDIIDSGAPRPLQADAVCPVWVTLDVPRDAAPGVYAYLLVVRDYTTGRDVARLPLYLNVCRRALPNSGDYAFHTDFWQQPYAVSRYYGVPRWSQRHFDLLRPYLQLLARGGQKVATAILFYEPWGEQSNDKFDAMVRATKHRDGRWSYDYSVFDHYVSLCDSCGISTQINCYSMVPWDMTFRYFDESEGRDVDLRATTADSAYRALWLPFLRSFAAHLRAKGWFEKTCIAMDERGLPDMQRALGVLREAVPDMKVSLAGNPHAELVADIYDYSLHYGMGFTPEELSLRDSLHLVSTVYTACNHLAPNLETYNEPADAAFLPLRCFATGLGGYLHWSWMNWTDRPLQDSRFKLFPPGDTYVVYPGPRSSIRWERYVEGVQQAEKCRLLSAEYAAQGDTVALQRLQSALAPFRAEQPYDATAAARSIAALKRLLNAD